MPRILSRIVLLLVLAAVALASPARADEVDDYLQAQMQQRHIPGLALAVVKDGKVIRAQGYGLANLELGVAVRPETVFKIASVSKQLLAAGTLLLVEDGKLSLDDKISRFLQGTPESWAPITIRQLLSHTSGIVREPPNFSPLSIQPDAEVIKSAYPLPLRFAPGEKWQYSNLGYFALAEIIHQASGKPWTVFMRQRVFAPLEMHATGATSVEEVIANRAAGYKWQGMKYQNADIILAVRPSGAFLSTVLDLAKWDAALYSDRLLKPSSREAMWTAISLNDGKRHPYGLGWFLGPLPGEVRHGGSTPGFRTELARFRDDKLTIIILTNGESARPTPMAMKVARHYLPGISSDAPAPSDN